MMVPMHVSKIEGHVESNRGMDRMGTTELLSKLPEQNVYNVAIRLDLIFKEANTYSKITL